MIRKSECVAMLLAGGQGSRLGVLTANIAKPAVCFGGKYRIIDFTLSNCVNSGINTVGVLTQYQPLELNEYIGNGQPWGLDRYFGGVHVLPPYQRNGESEWYKGTANAIYQNLRFIERYDPEYVLILSGDHIYKMDYSKMLDFHKKKGADCTIAVLNVPMEEASRFGIMSLDSTDKITEFEEKPKQPKSTMASMGIYIFNFRKLKEYLIADEANPNSANDFGKNVIPAMLNDDCDMYGYCFDGYWKDVGTIESLWEANMDLINPNVPMRLDDQTFKIYARSFAYPPQHIGEYATIERSLMTEGCEMDGFAENSILSTGCRIEKNARIHYSVIMPGAVIEEGAVVEYTIVGENVVVKKGAKVGSRPEAAGDKWGITVIGSDLTVDENVIVPAGTMLR